MDFIVDNFEHHVIIRVQKSYLNEVENELFSLRIKEVVMVAPP
jgi:hypothetical protein